MASIWIIIAAAAAAAAAASATHLHHDEAVSSRRLEYFTTAETKWRKKCSQNRGHLFAIGLRPPLSLHSSVAEMHLLLLSPIYSDQQLINNAERPN